MHITTWNISKAKTKFSDIIKQVKDGPQFIDNHGKSVAVILSVEDYEKLNQSEVASNQKIKLKEFLDFSEVLRSSYDLKIEIPLKRYE